MPYVMVSRTGAKPKEIFLPWSRVMATGIDTLVRQQLVKTGVTAVELVDDARSRVAVVEKPVAVARAQRRAVLGYAAAELRQC
ncbi:hypothetical protein ACG83_26015 [Frankia sp. R43]|uniref:hypothetical protein n=1 Tax=Frankia sp. R43 TaxID=269536 RepID=UPI0006CA42DF|nr:hypothetical protein [Frankia sp. R43]KPM52892.1 hypothetical protein ACG83_26015 [Frankia sp. R43]